MIDIIIVGYPKSGNTWVTRLVAELAGCPVVGFLDSDHKEIAREGLDRKSDYQCFKSHHQLHELRNIKTNTKKIICVVRDPRDIAISGSRYFHFRRWPVLVNFMTAFPKGEWIYNRFLKRFITPSGYRINRMVDAVLFGSKEIHKWVCISWISHLKPYMEDQCFFVKYEDLLDKPEYECKRIITFLGLDRDEQQIREAIEKQSFHNKKAEFLKNNESAKANFMKVGKKEQWRQALSKSQKKMFKEMLADELDQFGYHTSERNSTTLHCCR